MRVRVVLSALLAVSLAIPPLTRAGEGFGGLSFIAGRLDVQPMNRAFSAAGYPELRSLFPGMGGWGFGISGPFLLGGSGYSVWQIRPGAPGEVRVMGGVGFFDFGWIAFSRERVGRFVLLAGFGGGGLSMEIAPEQVEQDFSAILAEPRLIARVEGGEVAAKLGVQFDRTFKFAKAEEAPRLLVGLRVEYILPLNEVKWKAEEVRVRNVPDLDLEGLRLALIVGVGGGSEKRSE